MSEDITYADLNLPVVAGPSQRLVKGRDTEADLVYAEVKAKSLNTNGLDSCATYGPINQEVNVITKGTSQPGPDEQIFQKGAEVGGNGETFNSISDQRWCTRGRVLALTAVTGLLLVIGVTLVLVFYQETPEPPAHSAINRADQRGPTTTQGPTEPQMSSTTTRNTSHKSGCPPGWEKLEKNCYFFSQTTEIRNWNSSKEECLKNNSYLVIINDTEKLAFLNTASRSGYYFLGLTYSKTEGRWRWYNDKELNTNIFNVTRASHTSDYLCAVIGHGKVADAQCSGSQTTKYMCQKPVGKERHRNQETATD